MMQIRNPKYTEDGRIDCEILHPQWGWMPFTASSNDIEAHGRDIYNIALQMDVAPYAPMESSPEPPHVPQTLSRFQARAGLMQRGLLADVEALVANSSPLAQLAWAETIEWRRDSPTLNALAKDGLGLTDAEIDELFIAAAEIKA